MEEMKLKKKRLAIKLGLTLMITPVLSGMRAVTTIDEFKQIKSGLESDQMLVLADETRGKKINGMRCLHHYQQIPLCQKLPKHLHLNLKMVRYRLNLLVKVKQMHRQRRSSMR